MNLKWIAAEIRYRIAWWKWALNNPRKYGDPSLGKTRVERNRNIRLLNYRHDLREPIREDYGN